MKHLRDLTASAAENLSATDRDQGILSTRTPQICPHEIPKYAGTPSEDFVDFKKEFHKAMKSNRIAKPDQLRVLQEHLTGYAAQKIPPGYEHTIDDAWTTLQKEYGEPVRHICYKIKELINIARMSDSTSRRHPDKAARWLGQLEASIIHLLKLGDRSEDSGIHCFSETTIYNICERLPYSIYHRVCDIGDHGRKKLKQIINAEC